MKGRIPYFLSPGGFALNYASFVPALSIREYVILFYMGQDTRAALRNAQGFLGNVPCSISASDIHRIRHSKGLLERDYYFDNPGDFAENVLRNNHHLFASHATRHYIPDHAAAVWLCGEAWQDVDENRIMLTDADCSNGIWTASSRDRHSEMPIRREQFSIDEFPVAIHVVPDHDYGDYRDCADSLFVQVLKETLVPESDYPDQDLWIPFDMEERKKKFKTAFEELKVYMDYIKKYPID